MNSLFSYLKKPSTYVIAIIGAIVVLAFPRLRNALAPIAAKLPGAQ